MYAIFIDESGYMPGWSSEKNMGEQPFFVLSAVAFPVLNLAETYDVFRTHFALIGVPEMDSNEIGRGLEIKGRDIARGRGYWGTNEGHRNEVRNLYLKLPSLFGGATFLSIVKKREHFDRYADPADPDRLALQFLIERLQRFLVERDSHGILIYDQNKRIEDDQAALVSHMVGKGSYLIYFSQAYEVFVEKRIKATRLLEWTFGKSEYSLGLQVADFYASQTNSYLMSGKPADCGWWQTIDSTLKKDQAGKSEGYGYKEFP